VLTDVDDAPWPVRVFPPSFCAVDPFERGLGIESSGVLGVFECRMKNMQTIRAAAMTAFRKLSMLKVYVCLILRDLGIFVRVEKPHRLKYQAYFRLF